MAAERLKMFFSYSHATVHNELNAWLDENANAITITAVSLDSNEHGHCLGVLYREEPGPAYTGGVWFDYRHDVLEDAVNTELPDLPGNARFMAVGSNKLGHAICVICEINE